MRKKGFTLIELLVVIAIIAMLLAILMPALNKVKQMAMRVICGTNCKGLGTALMVYAQDYDDQYCVQSGRGAHPWDNYTHQWNDPAKVWEDPAGTSPLTVGASLYLLVREADVSPKSFKCPSGSEVEFDGSNSGGLDLVELFDFGHFDNNFGPGNCVSYAYQMPYGPAPDCGMSRFAASGTSSASFAVMADKNPWLDQKLIRGGDTADNWMDHVGKLREYWNTSIATQKWQILRANSEAHQRVGQNVLFGDGHSEWAKTSDVGVKHDNIYVPRGGGGTPEQIVRSGDPAATIAFDNNRCQPVGSSDSVLVNDDNN